VIVVLAEKPSVARDLAAVLGANTRRDGFLEGNGHRVTWAIGHLVGLAQPDEINGAWKTWSRESLPMLPQQFPLSVLDSGRAQYRVVERLLRDRETKSVIAATDAGREGELIFRYIYERAGCTKPWQRLWLASMTEPAIRAAFGKLAPGSRYDGLADAARARSQADWLVGLNLSRAYTLSSGTLFSVGRVQTPTLAMIVQRDQQIREFVPKPYLEVEATFASDKGEYKGTYYVPPPEGLRDAAGRLRAFQPALARLPADGVAAKSIADRARQGRASVAAVDRSLRRTPPPQLYDLTELQRHANQLYGYTAKQTLDAAQALYERYKVLSYPRTDSRHLSADVAATLPSIIRAIAPGYPGSVAEGSGSRALGKRFVDDSKVGDHHALIPTAERANLPANSAEARLYELVCRRLLMAWHDDLVESITRVVTEVSAVRKEVELFATSGTSIESPGWTVLEANPHRKPDANAKPKLPGGLQERDAQRVAGVEVHRKRTQPPKPFTEATLLTAMETAGKTLDDKALIEAMRDSGLGTPATRAATIETLLGRNYIVRTAKNLTSTVTGQALVAAVHPLVKSAQMTGSWELRLRRLERGEERFEPFMAEIASYVRHVVAAESKKPAAPSARTEAPRGQRRARGAKRPGSSQRRRSSSRTTS
jgi:DNA topoisomerase III